MRFYDREQEIKTLHDIRQTAERAAQFTVVTGRRRIGKTMLLLKAYENQPMLYFFVSRKAETELCADFCTQIEETLGVPMLGTVSKFADIFDYLMRLSHQRSFTLVIDEFQDFLRVNKSIFSDMQRIWDLQKDGSHINLLVCGSIHSLMYKLFRDRKEPLFGRQTHQLTVRQFRPEVLSTILYDYHPRYTSEDLLAFYLLTGGVAKYAELLMDSGCYTWKKMINHVLSPDSPFLDEGKSMLIEEFGKDYGTYFSILSLIARGHTTRSDMENMLKMEIGGYLTKLQNDYGIITRHRPLFAKSSTRSVRYELDDIFLRFWFRFIYCYDYMVELGAFDKLRTLVFRDYPTYSGKILEQYFMDVLKDSGRYTRMGNWYDRKGENEIDIIAADDLSQTVDFIEVKRQRKELDMDLLHQKADVFLKATGQYADYKIQYKGLTMEDMRFFSFSS